MYLLYSMPYTNIFTCIYTSQMHISPCDLLQFTLAEEILFPVSTLFNLNLLLTLLTCLKRDTILRIFPLWDEINSNDLLFEIRESHINKCSYKKKNTKYSVSECVDITVTIFANKSMDCQVCKRIKSLTLARNFLRTSMYNDFHTTYQLLTNHGIQADQGLSDLNFLY